MKISKGFMGVSALAATLAFSPAAFANPCNGASQGASNSDSSNQGMNGWQSSSTAPAGETANRAGNWNQEREQNFGAGKMERHSRLTQEANNAINRDPQLQDQDVHAWVSPKGVVVLKGQADSAADAMRAQHVIAQYTGLKEFDNELYYPGMYGGRATSTSNEKTSYQSSENKNSENAENENGESAATENSENDQSAATEEDNQNNGESSSSGPSMGQGQGADSSSGNRSGGNQ